MIVYEITVARVDTSRRDDRARIEVKHTVTARDLTARPFASLDTVAADEFRLAWKALRHAEQKEED